MTTIFLEAKTLELQILAHVTLKVAVNIYDSHYVLTSKLVTDFLHG